MEYINAVIGEMELYVPVNDKLGDYILLAQRKLNYKKRIAKMRKAYQDKIESGIVNMDSDFFYELEDVLEEKGYGDTIHYQIEKSSVEQGEILYLIFRDNKTISTLISAYGYEQKEVQKVIYNFFESLKKIIF